MQLDHERLDVYDLALEFLVFTNGIFCHCRSSNCRRTILDRPMEHIFASMESTLL